MTKRDPFRAAERWARCPTCLSLHGWNREDGLAGQICTECERTFHGRERPTYAFDEVWVNDSWQFPRLLAELRAAGLTGAQYRTLKDSMDLTTNEIDELLQRAEVEWQTIKSGS